MRLLILGLFFFLSIPFVAASTAEAGYRIEVELENFDNDTLLLGYYFGKAQYLKDTAVLTKGIFLFEGDDELKPGVYLLILPPDNRFIHVLITEGQTRFSMSVDLKDIVSSAKFKGPG